MLVYIHRILLFLFLLSTYFFMLFNYSCLHFHTNTPLHDTHPASHPQTYSLWLCPYIHYSCSLMALPLLSPIRHKQTSKIQPGHWNNEQTDSNQRGVGRRIIGDIHLILVTSIHLLIFI